MNLLQIYEPVTIASETTLAGGGGAGSSWQDQWLFWIPLFILIYIWLAPKVYSFLKTKFKKQIPEEPKQE